MLDLVPEIGIGRGAAYGAGLYVLQDEAVNSLTVLSAPPSRYPWQAHVRGLVSHLAGILGTPRVGSSCANWFRAPRISGETSCGGMSTRYGQPHTFPEKVMNRGWPVSDVHVDGDVRLRLD